MSGRATGSGGDAPTGQVLPAWVRRGFLPVAVGILMWAAVAVPLPLYAEWPGDSLDLSECVVISSAGVGEVHGDLLLTFASLRRAAVADLMVAAVDDSVQLEPLREVVGDRPPREHFAQQRSVFDVTAQTAAAVGLDRAGWPDPSVITGDGASVVRVLDGFPAEGVLQPGDLVVAADGQPIATSDELRALIVDSGGSIELTVHRGPQVDVVRLAPVVSDVDGEPRPVIGAQLTTLNQQVRLPVDVDVRAGRLGGPSAGLMIALSVYDAAAEEDLLAGRRVAGTGTITAAGTVGRIGKLPLKVIAAARQGATLFLVPESQEPQARAAVPSGSSLQVVGVETVDDAIAAIRTAARSGDAKPVRFRPCTDRVADEQTASSVSSVPRTVRGAVAAPRRSR